MKHNVEKVDLKKEYYFKGNNTGCLLIHGITSTPGELRELGENLKSEGYTVHGVRLKGHGTNVEDLEKCTYYDWIQSTIDGYEKLKEDCNKIYVAGHSMGAILSLYLAENYDIDKVITLSPPFINKKKTNLASIGKYFMRYYKWDVDLDERPKEEVKYLSLAYDKVPLESVHQLNKLTKIVKKDLNKVTEPLLIVHSRKDDIVDKKSVNLLYNSVNSEIKQKVILSESKHSICIECEKEKVFNTVVNFANS